MATKPEKQAEEAREMVLASVGVNKVNFNLTPTPLAQVLAEINPTGTQVKLADVVDHTIVVWNVNPFVGEYGPAAFVIFTDENNILYNTIIGQTVLLPKLCMVMDRLPVSAVVRKIEGGQFGYYYDFE